MGCDERRHNDLVTLKEYFQAKFDALEQARALADKTMNIRLESMNEFRAQIKDQTSTFITRNEHDIVMKDIQDLRESRAELAANFVTKREHDSVLGEIASLRESRAELRGKADQSAVVWSMIIGGMGIIIALATFYTSSVKMQQIEDKSYGYQDYLTHMKSEASK